MISYIKRSPRSIQDIIVNDLHVYPNPAVDMLYLSLEIPLEKVEIYNMMGQMVKTPE